jgi:hypothetical protein
MTEGLGTSIPTFFKFEPVGNAPFVCRDIGILAQKLGHVKVFHTSRSRQRSLVVTQSATNRGVPIPLNEYLRRKPKDVSSSISLLINQVRAQLAQLGERTQGDAGISSFLWEHLDRDAMERACLKSTSSKIWATYRRCTHGDLNATNIAIDADDPMHPQAYIIDASGMRADFELRDLATLEVTTILFASDGTDDQLLLASRVLYDKTFLPSDLPDLVVTDPWIANVVQMITAIRSHCRSGPERVAYALLVFDAALRQLSGLGFQPSPNKIKNPLHACHLAAWVSAWLRHQAPDLFSAVAGAVPSASIAQSQPA